MKWPVMLPHKKPPRLNLAIFDKDIFAPNDSICEVYLSLQRLFRQAYKTQKRVTMMIRELGMVAETKIWIDNLQHSNFPGENCGSICVSIEILPLADAQQNPAGFGRSAPNMNPVLEDPEGRIHFSIFHPLSALRGLMGDQMYYKLIPGFVITAIGGFFVMLGPMIVSQVIADEVLQDEEPEPEEPAASPASEDAPIMGIPDV